MQPGPTAFGFTGLASDLDCHGASVTFPLAPLVSPGRCQSWLPEHL